MRPFISRYKAELTLITIFVLAELIVWPLGEFPLNDDWAYTKSVTIFMNEGKIFIGFWAAMTLCTHILWGGLFVKIFGFSFFILRLSTMVSAIIGILVLYRILTRLTANRLVSFAGAATLMLTPIFFNISNTFMTDVNFTTLVIIFIYFSIRYFDSPSALPLVVLFILSVLLVLLRQFGIIFPVCFTVACIFLPKRRIISVLIAAAITAGTFIIFKQYEEYLRTYMITDSAYKFSGDLHLTDETFINGFIERAKFRLNLIGLFLFVYLFPFAISFIPEIFKKLKPSLIAGLFVICGSASLLMFVEVPVLFGNTFENMRLGSENFSFYPGYVIDPGHTYSRTFLYITQIAKIVLAAVTLTVLACRFFVPPVSSSVRVSPLLMLLLLMISGYSVMLCVSESFFDRYNLPLLAMAIILSSYMMPLNSSVKWLMPGLLVFAYISVAGTRDYFTLNRIKWEAYERLTKVEKAQPGEVNGGFEICCWQDGKISWWTNYLTLNDFNYLIHYEKPEGFEVIRTYHFKRYFPFTSDSIRVMRKTPAYVPHP